MAVITRTIQPGERIAEVTQMQQALINLGSRIAADELFTATVAGLYGVTTQAAVAALLRRFNFPPPSPLVFNAFVGRLLNIAVAAETGSNVVLRQEVRESFAAIQVAPAANPSELAWLARYAAIARDFTTARSALAMIPVGSPPINIQEKDKIGSVVNNSTLQPSTPELLNPENYYTILYDYVPRSTINSLMGRA
jgi:peptidoglycan hydrolase-like protein with peptidoglycan-binding domain